MQLFSSSVRESGQTPKMEKGNTDSVFPSALAFLKRPNWAITICPEEGLEMNCQLLYWVILTFSEAILSFFRIRIKDSYNLEALDELSDSFKGTWRGWECTLPAIFTLLSNHPNQGIGRESDTRQVLVNSVGIICISSEGLGRFLICPDIVKKNWFITRNN